MPRWLAVVKYVVVGLEPLTPALFYLERYRTVSDESVEERSEYGEQCSQWTIWN